MPAMGNIKVAAVTQAFNLAIKTAPAPAHHAKMTAAHYIKTANVRRSEPTVGFPTQVHAVAHISLPAPIAQAVKEFINAKLSLLRLAYAV